MPLNLSVKIERWPVAGAFTIARGAKTQVDVVSVALDAGHFAGCGEATPIYYHGETADTVWAAIRGVAERIEAGADRAELARMLPRGAARNAIDAALWDLEAKRSGTPVWQLAGLAEPKPLTTAFTISLGDPERMRADAEKAAGTYPLLKLKLAGEGDIERVAAVRAGAPAARLVVDANEAWTDRDVEKEAMALLPYGVELIEQPVKAGEDALLDGVRSPIPLCADESCQDRADLERCIGRYQAINIKLDKAGGLTEALAMVREARRAGMGVMVGCMVAGSLSMAPAVLLAQLADAADLDGPLWLAEDVEEGLVYTDGFVAPPAAGLWG